MNLTSAFKSSGHAPTVPQNNIKELYMTPMSGQLY